MPKSYLLKVDHAKCQDCGTCSNILRGFRKNDPEQDGVLRISQYFMEDEETAAAVDSVIKACPEQAIAVYSC